MNEKQKNLWQAIKSCDCKQIAQELRRISIDYQTAQAVALDCGADELADLFGASELEAYDRFRKLRFLKQIDQDPNYTGKEPILSEDDEEIAARLLDDLIGKSSIIQQVKMLANCGYEIEKQELEDPWTDDDGDLVWYFWEVTGPYGVLRDNREQRRFDSIEDALDAAWLDAREDCEPSYLLELIKTGGLNS